MKTKLKDGTFYKISIIDNTYIIGFKLIDNPDYLEVIPINQTIKIYYKNNTEYIEKYNYIYYILPENISKYEELSMEEYKKYEEWADNNKLLEKIL